jgi:tetratricopeptide (TPR) repeat protein
MMLGEVFHKQNDLYEALDNYQRALDIRLKYLSPTDKSIAKNWKRLGEVYLKPNNFDKSLNAYKNCLEIQLIIFLSNHIDIGYIDRQIGIIYSKLQKYDEALSSLQKSLIILSSSLFSERSDLIDTENLIIEILHNQ